MQPFRNGEASARVQDPYCSILQGSLESESRYEIPEPWEGRSASSLTTHSQPADHGKATPMPTAQGMKIQALLTTSPYHAAGYSAGLAHSTTRQLSSGTLCYSPLHTLALFSSVVKPCGAFNSPHAIMWL